MEWITTNAAGGQYWQAETQEMGKTQDCMHVVNVYPEVQNQEIHGFGGAFTEAATYNYSLLGAEGKREVMQGYFGQDGLRYNLGRTTIHSCDFALGNYTYVAEGDDTLESFSIDHDRQNMIPMIQEAMETAKTQLAFLASPWSPPAFMKTNGEMNHGGKLKKEYYAAWADYFVCYLRAYEAEGIRIGYITLQNEPAAVQTWDSCIYTAEEEGIFARDYLAPALRAAGLSDVKIFIWDHNKEEMYERASATLADEKTRELTAGVAVHWYTGDHFEAIEAVRRRFPEKEIFFTEGCVEYSRFADFGEVQKAEMYAHDMLGNLKAGVSAVFDWNLLLDAFGGPNHVGNFCAAPMMCDTTSGAVEKRLSYYYIGHFSRYIRRGARRIASSSYTDKIESAAFLNPDGQRVLVLLNKTDAPVEVTVREGGRGVCRTVAPHSIATAVWN